MKVLVLGATGMVGHTMARVLAATPGLAVTAAVRQPRPALSELLDPLGANVQPGWDALEESIWQPLFDAAAPEVVVNCVGLKNPFARRAQAVQMVMTNTFFAGSLWEYAAARGARLVHLSTDQVFSGSAGRPYTEDDAPDPVDLYGRTKRWGEPDQPAADGTGALTLRAHAIGPELDSRRGMLEWFLAQDGAVTARRRTLLSPLTTLELADAVQRHALDGALSGLYHLGGPAIDQDSLLRLVAAHYRRPPPAAPDMGRQQDHRLNSSRFCAATGWQPPDTETQIARMAASHRR